MSTKQVGNFTITVNEPYPIWISLQHKFKYGDMLRFTSDELDDLIYAATKAKEEAENKLEEIGKQSTKE